MRFNSKAISLIAELPSSSFDLEGVLDIFEKSEGIFKKQSGFVKRFVRLYGNLLFIFKGINHKSGIHCLYIMERYSVNICPDADFSFIVEFQDGDSSLKISTDGDNTLKKWLSALTSASSERMQIHLAALKERCTVLEEDLQVSDGISMVSENVPSTNSTLELILSCRKLNASFQNVNSMVEVYISNRTAGNPDLETFWQFHSQTEIVEDSSNPFYQVKVVFRQTDKVTSMTHLKFICKDIREQMSMTAVEIGSCILSVGSILSEQTFTIRKPLMGVKLESCGEIVITADFIDDLLTEDVVGSSSNQKRVSLMSSRAKSRQSCSFYKPPVSIYAHQSRNLFSVKFRFGVKVNGELASAVVDEALVSSPVSVPVPAPGPASAVDAEPYKSTFDLEDHVELTEHLAGTQLSFRLAEQILKIFIGDEKLGIDKFEKNDADNSRILELSSELLKYYEECLNFVSNSKEYYKQSIDKEHVLLAPVPTNFHLHRTIITHGNSADNLFDFFTVGAFTAFSMGYKSGGVIKHMLPSENITTVYTMRKRKNICISQGLTAIVIAMYTSLLTRHQEKDWCRIVHEIGPLFYFESLLSCHGQEKGMLEDMKFVINLLGEKLTFSLSSNAVFPIITRTNDRFNVKIPLPADILNSYSPELRAGKPFNMNACFFTIGINEVATLAEKLKVLWINTTDVQENINFAGNVNVTAYMNKFIALNILNNKELASLEDTSKQLDLQVNNIKVGKNVAVLHLASQLCLKMSAIRFTSCKSAKDRTAMSVTLEQAKTLKSVYLVENDIQRLLDTLRSQGVRRENTRRNTGHRRFAFNTLQLSMFPRLYRPPKGTYSSVQS